MVVAFYSEGDLVVRSTRNWVAKWNDDYECYIMKVDEFFIRLNPDSYGMIFACSDFIDDMTFCYINNGTVQLMPLSGDHIRNTFQAELKIAIASRQAEES